jgi:cell division protein FtsQ
MARKTSPTIQEELYPDPGPAAREELDDARLLDLEAEQESPFLRGQKRVSVRRGTLPKKTAQRLIWAGMACTLFLFLAGTCAAIYRYGERSWRFRIESSDNIEVSGVQNVARSQIMEVMGGDIGRNIYFVPLAERKTQLEQIPWVESASVMRFAPNRLKVEIHERTPVAFARIGSKVSLVDATGVVMELPTTGKRKYSFPVILGMNAGEPLSTRAPRMRIYNELISDLDSDGARHSQDLSEVDLTDTDDIKVAVADPNGEVLVHLGSSNYLERYKVYVTHVREWRQQFDKLESVDLRYDRQIIVNPDLRGAAKQAALSPAAVKAAMNAGVKQAALVNYEKYAVRTPAVSAAKPIKTTHASLSVPVKPLATAEKLLPTESRNSGTETSRPKLTKGTASSSPAETTSQPAVQKSSQAVNATPKTTAPNKKVTAKNAKSKAWKKSKTKSVAKKAVSKPTAKPNATAGMQTKPTVVTTASNKKKPSPAVGKEQQHP